MLLFLHLELLSSSGTQNHPSLIFLTLHPPSKAPPSPPPPYRHRMNHLPATISCNAKSSVNGIIELLLELLILMLSGDRKRSSICNSLLLSADPMVTLYESKLGWYVAPRPENHVESRGRRVGRHEQMRLT